MSKLDEWRKITGASTKRLTFSQNCDDLQCSFSPNYTSVSGVQEEADLTFTNICSAAMPKLLAVAEAAQEIYYGDRSVRLNLALKALEVEETP